MVRFETIFSCVCLAVILSEVSASGFRFGGPCDVRPQYKGGIPRNPDFSTVVQVPISCRNGTFRWHHPRGHALVKFNNKRRIPTSVCIRDILGGHEFTITDTTDNEVVGPINYDQWVCTTTTHKHVITLRVDAPVDIRYVAQFEYELRH